MARGWESKSVESQMESARENYSDGSQELSTDEKTLAREKQNLLLSRAYIQQQIKASGNTRYSETLRRALEEIESKLANLQRGV
jgi:hypothetical protein